MSDAPSPPIDAERADPGRAAPGRAAPSRPEGARAAATPSAGASEPAAAGQDAAASPDAVARLAASLQDLQARYDDLLGRFLDQVDRRQALDRALYAERFKSAALQRDLGAFQRQWLKRQRQWQVTEARLREAHATLEARSREAHALLEAALAEARAQRDYHKQLCLELQQTLHDMRHSRAWRLSQLAWNAARKAKRH